MSARAVASVWICARTGKSGPNAGQLKGRSALDEYASNGGLAYCAYFELRPFCGNGWARRKARVWLRSFDGLQCITTSIGDIHSTVFQH